MILYDFVFGVCVCACVQSDEIAYVLSQVETSFPSTCAHNAPTHSQIGESHSHSIWDYWKWYTPVPGFWLGLHFTTTSSAAEMIPLHSAQGKRKNVTRNDVNGSQRNEFVSALDVCVNAPIRRAIRWLWIRIVNEISVNRHCSLSGAGGKKKGRFLATKSIFRKTMNSSQSYRFIVVHLEAFVMQPDMDIMEQWRLVRANGWIVRDMLSRGTQTHTNKQNDKKKSCRRITDASEQSIFGPFFFCLSFIVCTVLRFVFARFYFPAKLNVIPE